jgi:hypothetical protein
MVPGLRLDFEGEPGVEAGVRSADAGRLIRRLELLKSEVADGVQHREPGGARNGDVRLDEALVDKGRECLQHIRDLVVGADHLRRVEGEAAGEDAEPGEEGAVLFAEKVVAPLDRVA